VIAVDTNILVAYHRTEYNTHVKAVEVITRLAESPESWAIPWPCIHEFVAVITNARIFKKPTTPAHAVSVVDALMESPSLRLLGEGPGYWDGLRGLVLKGHISGAKIHDARIAAICIENGVRILWTADRDFSRFPALKCVNPCI
jgi:toxin-antitoxin system PIN domain toxin